MYLGGLGLCSLQLAFTSDLVKIYLVNLYTITWKHPVEIYLLLLRGFFEGTFLGEFLDLVNFT